MTDDEIIDRLLVQLNVSSPVLFWSAYKGINSTDHDVKIEAIMDEMLIQDLIKKDASGNDDIIMVVLTKKGLDILKQGGWLKYRFNSVTDGQKIHRILEYMWRKDPERFDWAPAHLIPAFNGLLDVHEIQALCLELIDNGDVADGRSKDGLSIGATDRTQAAFHRKKYLNGQPPISIAFAISSPDALVMHARQNEIKRFFNTPYVDSKIKTMNDAVGKDTDLALGTAKELLETACKSILVDRKIKVNKEWTLSQLLKATIGCLDFSPKGTSEPENAEKGIQKILGGMNTVVHGVSELRNSYGTGHGKNPSFVGLESKYAKLIVGVVSDLVILLLATHGEGAELIEEV